MKLLYIGCHAILEYDELKMFSNIPGIELFSDGMYFRPDQKWYGRPPLNFKVNEENYFIWDKYQGKWNNNEFLDRFDIIYFMHRPASIFDNWNILKSRKIIWRTIGQSTPDLEFKMQKLKEENKNLKFVRYSPSERRHKNFAGEDALIRFGKNPDDYFEWNGNEKVIISVVQSMQERGDACGWNIFSKISENLPCKLYGNNNQGAGKLWNGENLSYENLLSVYRDNRVYFYAGTKPASYCLNFIEAWMTGIPIIAVGPELGNGDENLYEVSELISYGENGYWENDYENIVKKCKLLLENFELAKYISSNGRKKAIELFSEKKIQTQWEDFFSTL